jgi:hypothetical protein
MNPPSERGGAGGRAPLELRPRKRPQHAALHCAEERWRVLVCGKRPTLWGSYTTAAEAAGVARKLRAYGFHVRVEAGE